MINKFHFEIFCQVEGNAKGGGGNLCKYPYGYSCNAFCQFESNQYLTDKYKSPNGQCDRKTCPAGTFRVGARDVIYRGNQKACCIPGAVIENNNCVCPQGMINTGSKCEPPPPPPPNNCDGKHQNDACRCVINGVPRPGGFCNVVTRTYANVCSPYPGNADYRLCCAVRSGSGLSTVCN